MTLILLFLFAPADLSSVRSVADPEKRSEQALRLADEKIDAARQAYQNGQVSQLRESLSSVGDSVRLALDSVEEAPQQARRSKYFKRAELKTRALMRRLAAFSEEVSIDDRPLVEDIRSKVQEAHDHLLEDIMGNRKHGK